MEPNVGEKLCRLWAKIASDDDVLADHSSRRDNQGDQRTSGRGYGGHAGNHDYSRQPPMAYPPHPMFPYGYPPMGQQFYRPDARLMMHPPRLGLHHGGPFRPSRPWWTVTPPPHPQPHPPYMPSANKQFGVKEFKPSQPPPSTNAPPTTTTTSSNGTPPTNSPITGARSKNAYSAQRQARRQQQMKQRQQQEADSTGPTLVKPPSRAIEIKAPPKEEPELAQDKPQDKKTESGGSDQSESTVEAPTTSAPS